MNGLPASGRALARIVRAGDAREHGQNLGGSMLWTLAVVLIILWLLGSVTSYTMGGFIHILLVIAIVVILVRVIQGRKVL